MASASAEGWSTCTPGGLDQKGSLRSRQSTLPLVSLRSVSSALSTRTAPVGSDSRVLGVEGVPVDAMRLRRLGSRRSNAPQKVLSPGSWLQVGRVHAASVQTRRPALARRVGVVAQVVKVETFGYRTHQHFVERTVRHDSPCCPIGLVSERRGSVPRPKLGLPHPTAGFRILDDVPHDPFKGRHPDVDPRHTPSLYHRASGWRRPLSLPLVHRPSRRRQHPQQPPESAVNPPRPSEPS